MQFTLRPNERLIKEFTISKRFFLALVAAAIIVIFVIPSAAAAFAALLDITLNATAWAILSFISIVVAIALVLYGLYFRAARSYVLTNQRIFANIGWLSNHTINAEYDDITDIFVKQDVFERLLNIGQVGINTAGADIHEIHFERVSDPHGVSNQIRELCEVHQHSNEHHREHTTPEHKAIGTP